ncbi:unnamed protein product [Victoria cruziana]
MSLASILSLLSHPLPLSKTLQAHALSVTSGLTHDPLCATKLVRLYAVNGKLSFARLVFNHTAVKSVFLWNSMIRAFATARQFTRAFAFYSLMQRSETKPDNFTLACVLRACSDVHDIQMARMAHAQVVTSALQFDSISGSALISVYTKLGQIDWAQRVFAQMPEPDLGLWNSLISGYGYNEHWEKAFQLFSRMRNAGIMPDGFTIVAIVSCLYGKNLAGVAEGVHGMVVKNGFDSNAHVNSGLVTMYSRCSYLESAYCVFVNLSNPDLVTWSSLISGFVQSGDFSTALFLFRKFNFTSLRCDQVLISCVLPACANLASIGCGKAIHGCVIRHGFKLGFAVLTSLIHMYSRCGYLELARRVFGAVSNKNIVVYNAMISGLALNGHGPEAITMFMQIKNEGFHPNHSTFSSILCACSHCGLLDEGLRFFREMEDFGISPTLEHYVYTVNLLGMAGKLEEAYALIHTMPMEPDSGIWGALLSACRCNGNTEMGEYAAHKLFELEPRKTAYRVILSNLYATSGRWSDVGTVRGEMTSSGLKKIPAFSCISESGL